MQTRFVSIPGGDAGTLATLTEMAALVNRSCGNYEVMAFAGALWKGGAVQSALALRKMLARSIVFAHDPDIVRGVDVQDVLYAPELMVEEIRATGVTAVDCDDAAVLAASILSAWGIQTRFVAVALTPDGPYAHVWCEAMLAPWLAASDPGPSGVMEFDVTRPMQRLPVESLYRPLIFPVHVSRCTPQPFPV